MPYRFFVVPVRDGGHAAAELNGFLSGHRILAVDRRWVDQGPDSFWSFCVDYMESRSSADAGRKDGLGRGKIDYREVLSAEDFAVFARLRQLRKEIAQADAVPVYTIFTNDQLAQMVQSRATTKAALEKISGVGDARIEKFGAQFLDVLGRQSGGDGTGAPSEPPV